MRSTTIGAIAVAVTVLVLAIDLVAFGQLGGVLMVAIEATALVVLAIVTIVVRNLVGDRS